MKQKKNPNRRMPGFTENVMKKAVLKVVNDGVPVNRAARENGLCKKTLKSYVDKYLSSGRNKKMIRFRPSYEINQVFTNDLEKLFEEYLLAAHMNEQKITRDYIRESAFEFATKCNVHVPKTWNVRKKGGMDWLYGYLNRHPVIKDIVGSYKKTKYTDLIRAYSGRSDDGLDDIANVKIEVNDEEQAASSSSDNDVGTGENSDADSADDVETIKDDYFYSYLKVDSTDSADGAADSNCLTGISVKTPIDEFQENLTAAYSAIAVDSCVPSERVYNLGEIALVVENPGRPPGKGEIVVTACCFVNAAGESLPPFLVFPRKRFRRSMLKGLPDGVNATARRNGLMDSETFMLLLEHFQDLAKATSDCKVVLIMDDDDYHVTINSLDFCIKHGIELVTLPPHYAQKLQPIGRYVFCSLKAYFNMACHDFRTSDPDAVVAAYDVADLFCKIFPTVFTNEKIINGFAKTGIYPLDEEIFTSEEFLSTDPSKARPDSPLVLEHQIELASSGFQDSASSDEDDDEAVACAPPRDNKEEPDPCTSASAAPREVLFSNRSPIEEFFDHLVDAYRQLNEHGGIMPEKVYNLDEIELLVRMPQSGELKPQTLRVTVGSCVNAAGDTLPPFFIYPGEQFHAKILNGAAGGAKGTSTEDGAADGPVFLLMLQHFQQYALATPSSRVLLITDCEDHHVSLESIMFCEANGIILVTVPPHISEPFQPLEKTLSEAFPTEFRRECAAFVERNKGRCVSLNDVAGLYTRTSKRVFTPTSIVAGFESTGMWPLNKELFARDALCLPYTEMPMVENLDVASRDQIEETWVAAKTDEYVLTDSDDTSTSSDDDDDDDDDDEDEDVVEFFNNLDAAVDLLKQHLKNTAALDERIFVLGEIALSVDAVQAVVYVFVNAAGQSLPPFLVYPLFVNGVLQQCSNGMAGCASEAGTVDQRVFLNILQHFQQQSNSSNDNKALLCMESSAVLVGEKSLEFCVKHGIVAPTFPAKVPKVFNPLDGALLKPLKKRFHQASGEWKTKPCSVDDLAVIFMSVYNEAFSPKKIAAAFRNFCVCSPKTVAELEASEGKSLLGDSNEVGANTSEVESSVDMRMYEDLIIEEEIELIVPQDQKAALKVVFVCSQCEVDFDTKEHLRIHEKTHQPSLVALMNKCRYCDQSCNGSAERDEHERTHMKGNLHCCAFCDKECASRAALVQHRRKHLRKS